MQRDPETEFQYKLFLGRIAERFLWKLERGLFPVFQTWRDRNRRKQRRLWR